MASTIKIWVLSWRVFRLLFSLLLFFLLAFLLFDRLSPVDTTPLKEQSRIVKADDGSWLYATTNVQEKWRFATDATKLDPNFIRILLRYEDKRFYEHFGLDPLAMLRAIGQLMWHGRIISGGSTITMQLARLLHPRPRTVLSKLIEITRAFQLELHHSKTEILSMYLTLTPYGGNIEGIVAASMRYFGKQPGALSADEIALLVALPQSPERNRPDRHPKQSAKVRNRVLAMVKDQGLITAHEHRVSLQKKLPSKPIRYPRHALHLSQKILARQQGASGETATTIHKGLQKQVELWAKSKESILAKDTTLAVLIVRNRDAAIQAYLGSHNMFSRRVPGFVDMIQAIRSPGSTLKPFIYALGFQKHLVHPQTLILDQETRFGDYMPHNFTYRFTGEVTLAYALRHSLNIPAVKVLERVGAEEFITTISRHAGKLIVPKGKITLPVALGGLGISMWQLTQLYVALAHGGSAKQLHYLKSTPSAQKPFHEKLLSHKASRMTTAILRQTVAPKGFVNTSQQIAYKTGTSYGYRDVWTIAYNRDYTVAVWIGKPNNAIQLKLTGRKTAAPLAFELFSILNALTEQKRWDWSANYLKNAVPEGLKYFDVKAQAKQARLDFVYPRENTRYRSAGCSDAIVEVKVEHGKAPYYWYIDGKPKTHRGNTAELLLTHGAHTINIIDSNGAVITRNIWVDRPEC